MCYKREGLNLFGFDMDDFSYTQPSAGLTKISLTAFRSYESLRFQCDPRPVVLTGANGAGKTNILEALSLLSPGRGLRQAASAEILNTNLQEKAWAVSTHISSDGGQTQIGFGLDPEALSRGRAQRVLRINGENVRSQATVSEYVQVLWLTPIMDRLFLDSPADRRKFLDRLVYGLYPAHATQLKQYENAMRQRLKLLKEGRREESWLSSLEEQMASAGIAVSVARRQTIDRLSQHMSLSTGFPAADLGLAGWIDEALETGKAESEIEDTFKNKLAENRDKDGLIGMTRVGPHRSDLVCRYRTKNMPAAQCSTGEQKALLLSIMLAAARMQLHHRKGVPILLLDEVIAHLDPERRHHLYNEIELLGLQVWMTGTDQKPFEDLKDRAQFFYVEKNNVYPKNVV